MKVTLRKLFGNQVRALRLAAGWSQEAFADRCGFARSYMSRIERGAGNPSLDAIEVLADGLGVEVQALFTTAMAKKPAKPVKVPFAADGSCFHPGLTRPRTNTYQVGPKDDPQTFEHFEDALAYLMKMKTAQWRRPNANGNWGLVSAVRWAELPA